MTKRTGSARKIAPAMALRLAMIAGVFTVGASAALAQAAFPAPDQEYKGQVRLSSATRGEPVFSGSEVSVAGQNFRPGQKITLLHGATVLNPEGKTFEADGEGKFEAKFKLPEDAAIGTHPLVVVTDAPYNADIAELKVSPKVAISGEDKFTQKSEKLVPGLYQSVHSVKNGGIFVTSAVGRPPVKTSEIIRLDPETLAITARVTPAAAPAQGDREGGVFAVYGIDVDDANDTVWVTNTRQNTVSVYKQSDLSLVKQFEPGVVSHARDVAVDEKNGKAFASPVGVPEIVVFDTKTLEQPTRIKIDSGIRGKSFSPTSLALDEEGGKLYTVSMSTNEVAVIDTASGKVDKVFALKGARSAIGIAVDPATGRVFVAAQGSDNLLIADANTGETLHNVLVGAGALNVAFDPVGKLAYVSSRDAGTVTVVDPDGKIVANIDNAPLSNHVRADSKGNIYAINKGRGPEDQASDRITRINAVK